MWWNGIHNGLKIRRGNLAGSNPATRTKKTDLSFNRWVCLFLCPKVPFYGGFQFAAESKPIYAQVLCSVAIINLTINEFKERIGERMAIPYGFKKMPDGMVGMVASQIEVVQRIYQRCIDGASLGAIANEMQFDQLTAPSGNPKWSRSVIDKNTEQRKVYALCDSNGIIRSGSI